MHRHIFKSYTLKFNQSEKIHFTNARTGLKIIELLYGNTNDYAKERKKKSDVRLYAASQYEYRAHVSR